MNPDKPFVLRTDASGYAGGPSLQQMVDEVRMPTPEDAQQKKTVPVAFLSRKLTSSQRNWVPREQEMYAIVLALMKWETWIGLQPVLVLTDHQLWSTGLERCWMRPADQSVDGRVGTNSSLFLICQWGKFQGKTTR